MISKFILGIIYLDFFIIGFNSFISGPLWFAALFFIICLIKIKLLELILIKENEIGV
jgi:hypothetical protein